MVRSWVRIETACTAQSLLCFGVARYNAGEDSLRCPGAKRPSYSIAYADTDPTPLFIDIEINDEHGQTYLNAMFKGETQVRERLLPLDAERYKKGDIELKSLLHKYCAHFFMP